MSYVIVRGESSGVFAGTLVSRSDRAVVLTEVRWIWYWEGAASLSQMAEEGVKFPDKCKFPPEVGRIDILDAVQVFYCSEEAEKNIKAVPPWRIE
jgi:hypothetical protein